MYKSKLGPEESLKRIKLMMGYTLDKTLKENAESLGIELNEQRTQAAAVAVEKTPATTKVANDSDSQIANQIRLATFGMGTDEDKVFNALSQIKTAAQFWKINEILKTIGNKLDFQGIINDEYGLENWKDVQNIIGKLKQLGITATALQKGKTPHMEEDSFKITSNPVATSTDKTTTQQAKVTFRKNEVFPLKFQDQGEKIKQLQQALDIRNRAGQPNITGKFWTATEAAVNKKAAELGMKYNRNEGVTEDMFNAILNPAGENIASIGSREKTGGLEKTAADINATPASTSVASTAAAPTIPATPNVQAPAMPQPTARQVRQARRQGKV